MSNRQLVRAVHLLTPADVHLGRAAQHLAARADVLAAAYALHPERCVGGIPQPAAVPTAVWMNPNAHLAADPLREASSMVGARTAALNDAEEGAKAHGHRDQAAIGVRPVTPKPDRTNAGLPRQRSRRNRSARACPLRWLLCGGFCLPSGDTAGLLFHAGTRSAAQQVYIVTAEWDAEAAVWVATSEDVPGLATGADTFEALAAKLRVMVPELLELNGALSTADAVAVRFRIVAERAEHAVA